GESPITMLDWSAGEFLGVGCSDGHVIIVRPSNGLLVSKSAARAGAVGALALSPDGSKFAFNGGDRRIFVCGTQDGRVMTELGRVRRNVTELEFNSSGDQLLILREGYHSQIW